MNLHSESPFLLLACLLAPLLAGLFVLGWGRRIARQGDWLIALSLFMSSGGIIHGLVNLEDQAAHFKTWTRGWIWPRAELGSVTLGVVQDSLGLVMAGLAVVVAGVFLSNRTYLSQEPRSERISAGIAVSTFGVSVAWIALTPWLVFLGLMATAFGGFVALGSRWDNDLESEVASRFAWERVTSIVLTVVGACGLAVGRAGVSWIEEPVLQGAASYFGDRFGALILLLGVFLQFQSFPLLGGMVKNTEIPTSVRAVLTLLFPSWAALAILFRFEAHLRALEVLHPFGWIQLLAAALALGMAYSQQNWRTAFCAWISAGISATAAILALSGPINGLTFWIGFVLGAVSIAVSASTISAGGSQSANHKTRALWTKISAFLGVASATGMIGFVSSHSIIQGVSALWEQPAEWVSVLLVFFLFTVLGWKLTWSLARSKNAVALPWTTVLSPLILALLSLGVWWTGALSGGIIPGRPDQVLHPLVKSFFPMAKLGMGEEAQYGAACGGVLGAIIVAQFFGYFWALKGAYKPKSSGLAKFVAFLAGGYGIDTVSAQILIGIRKVGVLSENWIDRTLWWEWLPITLFRIVQGLSRGAAWVDDAITVRLDLAVRQGVDFPARVLQFLQNGNVQWYLLFALASGMAILVHFLGVRP